MIAGSFYMAERLYGLTFTEITGQVPVFHPDVRVWEVKDKTAGRTSACSTATTSRAPASARARGPRATAPRDLHRHHPLTRSSSNNNNFVRGAAGAPVLISLDDAETLFHEFGHASTPPVRGQLPGLGDTPRLRRVPVAGPRAVGADAAGPRQFARHYQTGKPMPQALVDKIEPPRRSTRATPPSST
jgi:peptidyl-dipeptidase Dcp